MPPHQAQGDARRLQILHFIRDYVGQRGFAPSLMDITTGVGLSSVNAVRGHLATLEAKGYLDLTPGVARAIVLVDPAPDGWRRAS